jgi:hypothetical protein
MKSKVLPSLLFLLLMYHVSAQKKALETITENGLRAHMEFIASDQMQGRKISTPIPGLDITADYLRSQLMLAGIKPAGESYFQNIEFLCVKQDTLSSVFTLKDHSGDILYESRDFMVYLDTLQDEFFKAGIVFAGYGWVDENSGYNDFEGLETEGKYVMIMTRFPGMPRDSSDTGWLPEAIQPDFELIFSKGAKGIMMFAPPSPMGDIMYQQIKSSQEEGNYLQKNENVKFFPGKLILLSNHVANEILKAENITIKDIQDEIHTTRKPRSFEITKTFAEIQLIKNSNPVIGKNVIAYIEGRDPVLKNEYLILGAHYDHLGLRPDGMVFNGADDNGSGTVALLEIAEAFSLAKKKPRRSIVFIWFTAEELGLIGSQFYAENPVFRLDNTLAFINLDMIGRVKEKDDSPWSIMNSTADEDGFYIVSCKQSSELTDISHKLSKKLNLLPSDALTDAFLNRSDYFPFYRKGIPVMGLSTGLHSDYHQVSDEVDKLNYTKMKRLADFTFLVTHKVADKKSRIVVDNSINMQK